MPPFRDLRLRAELSQREMGELLDVSQRSISQFELGARTIPPYVAENLRVRFNLTVEEMWRICYGYAL